jgi:hypothetical protein
MADLDVRSHGSYRGMKELRRGRRQPRAFSESEIVGSFADLGMVLNDTALIAQQSSACSGCHSRGERHGRCVHIRVGSMMKSAI